MLYMSNLRPTNEVQASMGHAYVDNTYYPYGTFPRWRQPTSKKTITKVFEYDENGRVVKETVTETIETTGEDYYVNPYQPVWSSGGIASSGDTYTLHN